MNLLFATGTLRNEGAQIRSEAVRSQLTLGHTLCSLAEQSITLGHFDHAHWVMQRLRRSTQAIAHHLNEPHHVTAAVVPELYIELQRLESHMATVEARLPDSE